MAPYALVVRRVEGSDARDKLIRRGVAACPPGSLPSRDPLYACLQALRATFGDDALDVALRQLRAECPSAAPQGPTGVVSSAP
jgi:hypothetical protein